jgi:hypothetical protein
LGLAGRGRDKLDLIQQRVRMSRPFLSCATRHQPEKTMQLNQILQQDASEMYHAAGGLFRLADDFNWKPATGSNWLNTGQLMHHCTNACGRTLKGFVTGDWGFPVDPDTPPDPSKLLPAEAMPTVASLDEALKLLEEDKAQTMKLLAGLDDQRLLNERLKAPWGGLEKTLLQHATECIWHLGQHKGQLFYYLKLQGKNVNTMHLWTGGA